jgi:hypothetical protein
MADSFTPNLNLRKPENGAAFDTWGGAAGLNSDLDLLDAVFLATGLGTSVGLHIGPTQTLFSEGVVKIADSTDNTKVLEFDASTLTTATTRILSAPAADGVIATQSYVNSRLPTGTKLDGFYGALPPGFVWASGKTIGSATSGATERANADTQQLFMQFWLLGFVVVGGAGASGSADWAANKQITLPNCSGRVSAGRDNLSGTNQGILSPSGIASTTLGAVGGAATESAGVSVSGNLSVSTNVSVSVSGTLNGSVTGTNATAGAGSGAGGLAGGGSPVSVSGSLGGGGTGSGTANGTLNGGTAAVTNAQPTIVCDCIIAL